MGESKMQGFQTIFFAERPLEIPRWFSKSIKMKTPSKVYLKGPIGGTAVELVRKDGSLYFKQGWKEFHRCHSLRDTDLLVFIYDDDDDDKVSFTVKMYQEKFGEDIKEERFEVNPQDTQNATQPQAQPVVAHDTEENRAMDSVDQDRLSFVKTIKHYNVRRSFMFVVPGEFISKHFSRYGNGKKNIEVVLENTRSQQWPVTLGLKKKTMYAGWAQFVRANEIKEGDTCKFVLVRKLTMRVHISPKKAFSQKDKRQASPEETQLRSAGVKKRRVLEDADDNEVREHRLPQNVANDSPSFTVPMKLYNVRPGFINMSVKFVSTHCCNYEQMETITLENEQGKQWSVTMNRRQRAASLSRGWPLFVRDNQIKEKDTCTFKLVDERKMLVQISRHRKASHVEEDPRDKLEHPTCNTDGKSRSDGLDKRKRGSVEADIAELKEENRKILQMLQEIKSSGAK